MEVHSGSQEQVMTINAQESSPELTVNIILTCKVFNSNKSKPIELTEERVKQRIQTVLYPLGVIDKNYTVQWHVKENHNVNN